MNGGNVNGDGQRRLRGIEDFVGYRDEADPDDAGRICVVCDGPMGDATGLGCDSCREYYEIVVRPKLDRNSECVPGGKRWVTGWARNFNDAVQENRGMRENGVRAMEDGRS